MYLSDSKLTPRWLYAGLLDQMGLESHFYRGDSKRQLQKEIENVRSVQKKRVVCVLDEAHLLGKETLEEFRFLLNYRFDSASPMSLILVGQTELWEQKLRLQSYAAIRQRIDMNGKEITQFDHADVEISKMKILIDKGILVMNAHNITFIRDHYPEVIFDFIRKNIEEYCAIVKNGQSNHEETTEVLKWEVLTIGQAEDIIDYTGGTFSVVANHYPDDIMLYLMENNFEEDDIKPLTINYSNYKPEIQNVIQKLAVSRVHVLCSIIEEIDSCLIFDLLNNAQLGKNCKIELLVSIIETAKTKDVHDALNVAGYKELAKLFEENKRPRIVISEEHGLILDALKKHRHIGSYEPDSTSSFYRVKRLRNNKNVSIPTSLL